MNRKAIYFYIGLIIFTITIVLIYPKIDRDDTNNNAFTNETYEASYSINTIVEKPFGSEYLQSFDELVGYSDTIVLVTVTSSRSIDSYGVEYKLKVNELYKPHQTSKLKTIYIHTYQDVLKDKGQYILFLTEANIPYFIQPSFRLVDIQYIIGVQQQKLYHRIPFITEQLSLTQLEQNLIHSPSINFINEPRFNTNPEISDKKLSLNKRIKKADFIAHVKITDIVSENIYVQQLKLETKHIYYQSDSIDYSIDFNRYSYYLPKQFELGLEYLLFLQYDEGMFYTLDMSGSMIPFANKRQVSKAIKRIEKLK